MYKIKYILNILRDILYLTMKFYFSTLIKLKVSRLYSIILRVYIFSSALKSYGVT